MRWAWLTHMPKYLTQLGLSDCVVEAKSNVFLRRPLAGSAKVAEEITR